MSKGKLFYTHTPATDYARCPTVENLLTGTNRLLVVKDGTSRWDVYFCSVVGLS